MAEAETELKFLFEERDLGKITSLVSAASGLEEPARQRLQAIVFRYAKLRPLEAWFHAAGALKRNSHVQTVKQLTSSSVDRGEWEAETAGPEPDLDLLKNTPLARLAAKSSIRQALKAAFEVNVERTTYLITARGGVIEASLRSGRDRSSWRKAWSARTRTRIEER